ncbi:MAG: ribbon-helix-helix domain-containing protein [Thermomicrobia bacterium]|nr:ribbon-helix-helix domain-containing protein [Thermomicrobia bacterium]
MDKVSVRLPGKLPARLRAIARRESRSQSSLAREAVEQYLELHHELLRSPGSTETTKLHGAENKGGYATSVSPDL